MGCQRTQILTDRLAGIAKEIRDHDFLTLIEIKSHYRRAIPTCSLLYAAKERKLGYMGIVVSTDQPTVENGGVTRHTSGVGSVRISDIGASPRNDRLRQEQPFERVKTDPKAPSAAFAKSGRSPKSRQRPSCGLSCRPAVVRRACLRGHEASRRAIGRRPWIPVEGQTLW